MWCPRRASGEVPGPSLIGAPLLCPANPPPGRVGKGRPCAPMRAAAASRVGAASPPAPHLLQQRGVGRLPLASGLHRPGGGGPAMRQAGCRRGARRAEGGPAGAAVLQVGCGHGCGRRASYEVVASRPAWCRVRGSGAKIARMGAASRRLPAISGPARAASTPSARLHASARPVELGAGWSQLRAARGCAHDLTATQCRTKIRDTAPMKPATLCPGPGAGWRFRFQRSTGTASSVATPPASTAHRSHCQGSHR